MQELRQVTTRLENSEKRARQAERQQHQQASLINSLQEQISAQKRDKKPVNLEDLAQNVDVKRERSYPEKHAYITSPKIERSHDTQSNRESTLSAHPPSQEIHHIPQLPENQKLNDGSEGDAPLWQRDISNRLRWYHHQFIDDEQKFEYIYENTKGDAARLARSYRLYPPDDWCPQDFINFLTEAFDNPAKHESATTDFDRLMMSPNEPFWDFWGRFRTIASDAEYRDDRFLREQMRAKVLVRLSNVVQLEWDRCKSIHDYVNILQKADAHFQGTQQRQRRRSNIAYSERRTTPTSSFPRPFS